MWVSLAVTVVVAALIPFTLWRTLEWTRSDPTGKGTIYVDLSQGAFMYHHYERMTIQFNGWKSYPTPRGLQLWPTTIQPFTPGDFGITLPLWPVVFAGGVTSLFLWRSSRSALPGHCSKCNYDLANLPTSSPCPECGSHTSTNSPT